MNGAQLRVAAKFMREDDCFADEASFYSAVANLLEHIASDEPFLTAQVGSAAGVVARAYMDMGAPA